MPAESWDPIERDRRYASAKRDGLPRLLTEGDSWFDYPPHPNIIDWLESEGRWAFKRLEKSGDTVKNIATEVNLAMVATIARREKPDCILLSAGGNDLFVPIPEKPTLRWIWRALLPFEPGKSAAEHVNPTAWDEKKTEIRLDLVRIIGQLGKLAPIVVHGYDYLIASGVKVRYDGFRLSGPWILPAMEERGINDPLFQREILRVLIDEYNEMLAALQLTYPESFIHLDLRGTLSPERDWLNEIHPTEDGFRRVARKFVAVLDSRVPAVRGARELIP
jgi:lysophospholipase L1-like esterase